MPKTYSTADHLLVSTVRSLEAMPQRTAHGFVARLESVNRCFTWNKTFNMDVVKACGDLLFLLSFTHDGEQAKRYNPDVATDEGLVVNAYGPHLREQLATLIASLHKSLYDPIAVLCAWNGIEDQQNAFFHRGDEAVQPNNLLTAQFLFDGKRLHCITTFRSMDTSELPYLVFTWARMLDIVAATAGVPPGSLQIQSGVVSLPAETPPAISSEGWFDKEPPLKICDSPWLNSKDPIQPLEDAAVVEELMRREFKFSEHRKDIERFVPFSTLSTCLTVAYLHAGCSVLQDKFPDKSIVRSSKGFKFFRGVMSHLCDERLSERVLASVWERQQSSHS